MKNYIFFKEISTFTIDNIEKELLLEAKQKDMGIDKSRICWVVMRAKFTNEKR